MVWLSCNVSNELMEGCMLSKLTVRGRMYLIIGMTLFMFMVNAQFAWLNINKVKNIGLEKTHTAMLDAQKSKIQVATHSMALALAAALKDTETSEEQVEAIRRFINPVRYENDNSGYFFVFKGTVGVAIGPNQNLQGKNLDDLKDENGVYFIRELAQKARSGGGGVDYFWTKPDGVKEKKITYAEPVKGTDYWVGTGFYTGQIDTFIESTRTEMTDVVERRSYYMIGTVGFIFLLITLVSVYIIHGIVVALRGMIDNFKDISQGEGDLTKRVPVNGKDELSELGRYFNDFLEKLQAIIVKISQNSGSVDSSSSELLVIAKEMQKNSGVTSEQADKVTSSAEEMTLNLTGVAKAVEDSNHNAAMVAAASEEMSATINEIAENSAKARTISDVAVEQSKNASERIAELGRAAEKIGRVTETITDISEQTNLLALNATIEAARAGGAGKGFAVVANEIKELAKQTAEATQDIKKNIDGVQHTTESTVESISEISNVINQVNDIVAGIATAVEEQSVATSEIANSITRTSTGIQEVSENVNQSSVVSNEISQDIEGVNEAATELSTSSNRIKERAEGLSDLSFQLTEIVNSFKV